MNTIEEKPLIFDIEGDGLRQDITKIWCLTITNGTEEEDDIDLEDVEATVNLIVAFVESLEKGVDLSR